MAKIDNHSKLKLFCIWKKLVNIFFLFIILNYFIFILLHHHNSVLHQTIVKSWEKKLQTKFSISRSFWITYSDKLTYFRNDSVNLDLLLRLRSSSMYFQDRKKQKQSKFGYSLGIKDDRTTHKMTRDIKSKMLHTQLAKYLKYKMSSFSMSEQIILAVWVKFITYFKLINNYLLCFSKCITGTSIQSTLKV